MIYSVQQIKFEILAHIKEFGGDFSDWYIGISSDPQQTLQEQHQVDTAADIWLFKQALTLQACATVQNYFLQRLQTDGACPTVTDADSTYCVYAYRKSTNTLP